MVLICQASEVVVEIFHLSFEPQKISFLNSLDLVDVLLVLVIMFVKIDSSNRIVCDWRSHFLLEETFVGIFAEPRMS